MLRLNAYHTATVKYKVQKTENNSKENSEHCCLLIKYLENWEKKIHTLRIVNNCCGGQNEDQLQGSIALYPGDINPRDLITIKVRPYISGVRVESPLRSNAFHSYELKSLTFFLT